MAICKARPTLIIEGIKNDSNGDENNNPFQLKHCYIRLEKLAPVERAIASGFTTLYSVHIQ